MRTLSKPTNAFDEGRLTLGTCVCYRSVHLKKGHLTSGLEDEQLAMPTGGRGAFQERELREQRPGQGTRSESLNLSQRSGSGKAGDRGKGYLMWRLSGKGRNLALCSGIWEAIGGLQVGKWLDWISSV